jgi:hypothetical protein
VWQFVIESVIALRDVVVRIESVIALKDIIVRNRECGSSRSNVGS